MSISVIRQESKRRPALWASLLVVAGCGGGVSGEEVITLRFWGLGREGEVVAELVPEFEREHPNIRVQVQQIPWTAAHEKLLTAHVGGSLPDVAQIGNTWVSEFAAIRALEPLDTFITASSVVSPDKFFGGSWATNIVNDTVWGLPWYVETRVIFYRHDILARAGYREMPPSWAEWLEALRAVKRIVGAERYPIFLPTNEWVQPVVFGMQNGSTLLNETGTRGAFSEPAFSRAFDFYLDLFRSGFAPAMGANDIANPFQEFARGYFVMWITGPWNMGEMKRRLPAELQDDWSTAPLPGPEGAASGFSYAGGASVVVFARSRHKEAAWQLVEFLSRPEQQLRLYELTGTLPAVKEAWQRANLPADAYARAFWEQLQRVQALPAVPEIESIVQKVAEHAEASIRGGRPAQESLRALDADVDRMLEKRRWLLARSRDAEAK